jgi:DNA-binding transcriptional regulator YhcF (GntR family)
MFVSPGAEEKVLSQRRAAFYDDYVRPLVREGRSLGLDGQALRDMVAQAAEEQGPAE